MAWALCGVRGVIRTPLEAFRPSGEIHLRRPDKLPYLPHKRIPMPSKSDLRILYQTGVSFDFCDPPCFAKIMLLDTFNVK